MRGLHNGFKRGFALPTVLIASVILLTVLAVAVSATAAVRTTLKNQYYEQLAQTAGEAGVAYAKACLAENENVPQWTDEKPLTPATDCAGNSTLEPVVEALVVGGGGSGGGSTGGGGGAGGVITSDSVTVTATNYPVVVGAGGAAVANSTNSNSGANSSFNGLVAIGGGGGAYASGSASAAGKNGGSGGGAQSYYAPVGPGSGTAGQGFSGGIASLAGTSGGGGAGGVGSNNVSTNGGGNGGPGIQDDITGANVYYAGGGGSGASTPGAAGIGGSSIGGNGSTGSISGTAGVANTGSGGGGGWAYASGGGGAGGSGVVIISYLTNGGIAANVTGTVATTTNGLYTVHRFTGNGSFNVTSAGAATCPTDPRCSVTVNGNVRSSFTIGLPTLDADGKAVKIPAGGYTEITRTSNGSVWRTYRQPSVQAAVVPDLCSGATSSTLGWQAVVLPNTDLDFEPTDQADVIGISTSSIPFGPSFYRKDFTVTSAGTYEASVQTAGPGVPDDAEIYVDGKFVARSDDQSLGTGSIALTAGCHNVVVRFINSHTVLANSAGRFAASVIKEGASIPIAVSDGTWRATAGGTVNFAHKDFYTASDTWGLVRDIQTAVSINSAWTATSGENGARWISTTHNLSGSNYPASEYAFFRDSRTITVASPTDVRITYNCDNDCSIYLDGSIIANGTWNNVFSTDVTLSEGTHQLGAVVYNSSLSASGFAIAVVRISDGAVLTRTDASWLAGMRWQGSDTPMYSYDASFNPVPNTEVIGTVRALVVGGGGSGGSGTGGGGGGGGVVYVDDHVVRVGAHSIVVGAGGVSPPIQTTGNDGSDSSALGLTAIGGGGGGHSPGGSLGRHGGSGGGGQNYTGSYASGSGVIGQGNDGGPLGTTAGAGGGGAGGPGIGGAGTYVGGAGGPGIANSITGTSVYYGGGGGGAGNTTGNSGAGGIGGGTAGNQPVAADAAANTGGGGGGGWAHANGRGGAGGSGVVIISYPTGSMTAAGGTITTSGGYTIHTFTSSGTFTVTSID